jgi:ATP-binding cassette subfamily B multidrug efflux pump
MKMKYHSKYDQRFVKQRGLDWSLIRRLMKYVQPYKYLFYGAILLLIVAKGVEAYVPIYIGYVTQTILSSVALEPIQKMQTLSIIIKHCIIIFSFITLAYMLDGVNVIVKNWIGQKSLYQLRIDVYSHIQSMPLEFYNKSAVGTLMTRTIHDVEQVNQLFSESLVPLVGSIILFFCVCIGLILLDWRAAIVLIAILPIVFVLTNFFRYHQRRCYDKIRAIVAALNAFVQEHLMGASTIRSFGLEKEEKRYFEEINEDHRNANIETIHYFALFFAGIDFIQSLALISVFAALVVFSGVGTAFDAGVYFTFSLYVLMLFRPLADLAERYNLLQSAIAASARIFQVLDLEIENPKGTTNASLQEIGGIEFDNVWFAYKDENWILRGLSFKVEKGESIAFVGITGAGKTTVMNLLLRFYDIQKGEIRINGKNIREFSLQELRRQFSVVLQDPEIFSGTILENITLNNPSITKEMVESVVDFVNLRSFIDSLPDGIEHKLFERGKSLSAGQRQLISFARAVAYNRNALILDEATANIDSNTEIIIQQLLKKILHGKTCIVIAHRLSTIKDVDKIFVLHAGVVKEQGTHQELLKNGGFYEKLYRLQFMDKI